MRMGARIALLTGKSVGHLSRLSGAGGGTTLPGRVARRLYPSFVREMAGGLPHGCVLVTGTNGKTTTATLLALILDSAGVTTVHNRTGANLMAGIASALLRESDLSGRQDAGMGLFEVDEAALPAGVEETAPRLVLINNLFRDQLDRYGELDTLAARMRGAVETMDESSTVILNADDPLVASIGRGLRQRTIYFGIDSDTYASSSMQHAADSKHCSSCGSRLDYQYYLFGHLGRYSCPSCGLTRPEPQVSVTGIEMRGMEGSRCEIRYPGGSARLEVPLPGLYNVYNATAAFACAHTLGVGAETIETATGDFTAAFGRVEKVEVDGRFLLMILAKNPAGLNEVMRTLSSEAGKRAALFALNDNIADGRDVSWIWDADFELLRGRIGDLVCSGIRAWDLGLRVKYAELEEESLLCEQDLEAALDAALSKVPDGGTLYVVPTYTAMLDLRGILVRRGLVTPYWED